jgi:hypothetical protein
VNNACCLLLSAVCVGIMKEAYVLLWKERDINTPHKVCHSFAFGISNSASVVSNLASFASINFFPFVFQVEIPFIVHFST